MERLPPASASPGAVFLWNEGSMLKRSRVGRFIATSALAAVTGSPIVAAADPQVAGGHLPVVDIVPTTSWTTTSDGFDVNGGPHVPVGPTNGYVEINGTVMIPIAKGVSASYDRVSDGAFDASLSSVVLGGRTIYPGATRDVVQAFHADYRSGRFTVEGGLEMRHRRCCPAGSYDWHKDYVGLTYVTPAIKPLHDLFFVLNVTGNTANHYTSPDAAAGLPPGLDLPKGRLYTTQQSATAILPVNSGVNVSGTYLWGGLDFPFNYPFPNYFGLFVISATKQVDPTFGVTVNFVNLKQRRQGFPFPAPFGINNSSLDLLLDVHLDFNKIVSGSMKRVPRRPSDIPGAPGAPGGPQPVQSVPTGASPAPSATP